MNKQNLVFLLILLFLSSSAIPVGLAQASTTRGTFTHRYDQTEFTVLYLHHRFESQNETVNVIVMESDDFDSLNPMVSGFDRSHTELSTKNGGFTLKADTVYYFDYMNKNMEELEMGCPKSTVIDHRTFFKEFSKARKRK